ncbi:hypothetical protein Tco_0023707 [Tanacetum coccineum]
MGKQELDGYACLFSIPLPLFLKLRYLIGIPLTIEVTNDDDGSNNVEKEKEPTGEAAVNAEKDSVFSFVLGLDVHACVLVYTDGRSADVDLNTY